MTNHRLIPTRLSAHLAAAALLTALALPALAQTPPPPPGPGATPTAPARNAKDPQERHQARHAQRLAAFKEQLKLTPAQESAWASYTAAMAPPDHGKRPDRSEMDKLSTPERIDRMRQLRAEHAAQADKRDEATKTFYASLSAEQKKTFDAQAQRHHRMDGPRGKHGRHGEPGDGHRGPMGPRGADRPTS